MTDVTVNIRGDASQLRNELDDVSHNSTLNNNSVGNNNSNASGIIQGIKERPQLPTNERMIDDIRGEMQQRGVILVPGSSSITQIVQQYGKAQGNIITNSISKNYDEKRATLNQKMSLEYDNIDKEIEEQKKSELSNLGNKANDPFYRSILDQQIFQQKESKYENVGKKFDIEGNKLDEAEKKEKSEAENELTTAIKDLSDFFNRQAKNESESYIGKLRTKQKTLISERDSSKTEEETMNVGKRLSVVNEQLDKALNGGQKVQGRPYYDSMMQGSQGLMNMFSGIKQGDAAGSIMGGGAAIAGLSGMGLQTALKFLGILGVVAGVGKAMVDSGNSYENLSTLSSYRSTSGNTGKGASEYLGNTIPDINFKGRKISDYGFDTNSFATEASKRINSRQTSKDWIKETLREVGLERNLALQPGSLQQGAKYDRYGINVTDAIMRMVDMLSNIKGSGVSMDDFTRVKQKYDIQQQIMSSYLNRTDKPNYDSANKTLAAFSSVKGITQDERIGSDIQSFQNAIQNPMNERMRALIYSSISDLFPETGGRMDLVDRKMRDPQNEGKIMQAVVERIASQFGGTDTQMGYYVFKSIFPNIAPERLDAYIKQFKNGEMPANLLGGEYVGQQATNNWAAKAKDNFSIQSTEFFTGWTKFTNDLSSQLDKIIGKMGGTVSPSPNRTKSGGNR